jgi:DNA repair protein RadA
MKNPEIPLRPGFHTADEFASVKTGSGIIALDSLLGGGLESGLVHLFYGERSLHDDFHRIAVKVQTPKEKGGLKSPVIIIDSANIIKLERFTHLAYEYNLEPEVVMDRIYISRAFNSSQTYDLVMNQLEGFLDMIPARILMVTGLPQLYIEEGFKGEGMQEISHMSSKISTLTLRRGIFTLVSAPVSKRSPSHPEGGRTLTGSAQIHIKVSESNSQRTYTLAKHPQYPVRRTSKAKTVSSGTTLPLSYFLRNEESVEDD